MRKTSPKGTKLPPRRFWTDADVEKLKELYPNTTNLAIAEQLDISLPRVEKKARTLGLLKTEAFFSKVNSANAVIRFTSTWSPADIKVLQKHYNTDITLTKLSALMGRSIQSLMKKAGEIGLKRGVYSWSEADDKVLRDNYPKKGAVYVQSLMSQRTLDAVRVRAQKLGLKCERKKNANWTDKQDTILRDNYPTKGCEWVATAIGRTPGSVMKRASMLQVGRDYSSYNRENTVAPSWSEEEDNVLREHYPTQGAAWVAVKTNRTVGSVTKRAYELKVKRDHRSFKRKAKMENRAVSKRTVSVPRPAPSPVIAEPMVAVAVVEATPVKPKKTGKKPKAEGPKKWYHYPMNSQQYKEGLAAHDAGKTAVPFIDDYGREAVRFEKAAA